MTTASVRLHMYGNAASHRRCWDANTFVRAFKRSRPFPELVWDVTTDIEKDEIYFCAEYPVDILRQFVSFVETFVRKGLGQYQDAQICVTCAMVGSVYSLTVRALYGARQTYQIIVHSPESALEYVSNFAYLFESMETLRDWDVNSIIRFASIPNGIHFDALESDACIMFNYLSDELREQIPLIMEDVADERVLDVFVRKSRRGNRMYIRIGIQWQTRKEWGAPVPRLPVVSGSSVQITPIDHSCPICIEPLSTDLVQWNTCKHVFHLHCVHDLWCNTRAPTCPLCRQPMSVLQKVHIPAPTEPKRPRLKVTRSIASRVKSRKRKLFQVE